MNRTFVWLLAGAVLLAPARAAFSQLPDLLAQGRRERVEEAAQITASGRVESVADRNTFVLTVRGMTFRVTAPRSRGGDREVVRVGDRVRVVGDLADAGRIVADELEILQRARQRRSESINGNIRRLDRLDNTIVVGTPSGNFKVLFDRDTEFTRGSAPARLSDFRIGDQVQASGRFLPDGTFRARRIAQGAIPPGWSSGARGEIVALDSRAREAQIDFEGEVWLVRLRNTSIQKNNRRIEITDLHLGDEVRVTGTAPARGQKVVDATAVQVVRDADADERGSDDRTDRLRRIQPSERRSTDERRSR